MTNYSDFASRLNKAVYGEVQTSSRQITMEDIAKCRGSNQSMPSLLMNNLRVFVTKGGQIVTDAKVREILSKNGADNIETISKLFKEAPTQMNVTENVNKHVIIKDQKMAADLGEIFGKAALELHRSADGYAWGQVSTEANKAHIILSGRRVLEKQNPLDLLRAAAFEAHQGIESKGMKEHFIKFLKERESIPKNEKDLNMAYQEFIKDRVSKEKHLETLKDYINEKPQLQYRMNLSLEQSGLSKGEPVASNYESMTAKDLLKPFQAAQLKENILSTFTTDAKLKREKLEKLFSDKDFAEPILENLSKMTRNDDIHRFIIAVMDYNTSPSEQKLAEIYKRFLTKGVSKELMNLTNRVEYTHPLDVIYNHIVGQYVGNVLSNPKNVDAAIEKFDVNAPRVQQKPSMNEAEDVFGVSDEGFDEMFKKKA